MAPVFRHQNRQCVQQRLHRDTSVATQVGMVLRPKPTSTRFAPPLPGLVSHHRHDLDIRYVLANAQAESGCGQAARQQVTLR